MSGEVWEKAAPESVGFVGDLEERLSAGVRSGLLRDLHAVAVYRGGSLVLEQYYSGEDQSWGQSLGEVHFGPDILHDLRSVTKSITSLLYGIALDRKLVPPVEAFLSGSFTEYAGLFTDEKKKTFTIEQALTMSLGLLWNEKVPYTSTANSEIAMEMADDRYLYILEQQVIGKPGEKWGYSGGATALVGAIIEKRTGKTLPDFAKEVLFDPLGITNFEWHRGRDGIASPASGLRLSARDLLKIGKLLLDKGVWQGERIVSEKWISSSFEPRLPTDDGLHYGRGWFVFESFVPALSKALPWAGAFGNGGQRLWVMPEADVCAVVFAGEYNNPDAWICPTRVWVEIVARNLVKA